MRIGNQTAVAAADAFDPFHFAVANGFNAFEWFDDRHGERGFDVGMLDETGRARLRAEGAARDIRFSVHAPWFADPWRHEDDEPLRRSIAFAADIDADPVVVHLNPDAPVDEFASALTPAARFAASAGVRLALENTVRATPGMFNALFTEVTLPEDLRGALGMCYDIGHANLCPQTMYDYVGYLDRLDARVPIIHAHMHENFGDADSHLTLFTGPAATNEAGVRGVVRRLHERGFDGSIIFEQWPEPATMLCAARDRLDEMIADVATSNGECATPQKAPASPSAGFCDDS